MDNVCHTLVGAALGAAGLHRRTRYASGVLMIAANLPDLDVLVFATDTLPVSFRRGWTHGVVAQALLPVLLTGAALLVGRRSPPRAAAPPLHAGWLLALAYLGVYSHVFLDFLNNYGVRLLAPLDWRWFYGDAVFIVDPWLWLLLGGGVWLARRQLSPRPARGALLAAACYIAGMLVSAQLARGYVLDAWQAARGTAPAALMVGPVPASPLTREVIVDAGGHYETGVFTWWPLRVTWRPERVPAQRSHPGLAAALQQSADMRGFLVWSRFPFFTTEPEGEGTRFSVHDMRFRGRGGGFEASTVVAPAPRPAD